jgi:hypothetical protein
VAKKEERQIAVGPRNQHPAPRMATVAVPSVLECTLPKEPASKSRGNAAGRHPLGKGGARRRPLEERPQWWGKRRSVRMRASQSGYMPPKQGRADSTSGLRSGLRVSYPMTSGNCTGSCAFLSALLGGDGADVERRGLRGPDRLSFLSGLDAHPLGVLRTARRSPRA